MFIKAVLFLFCFNIAFGADENKPHIHNGILEPYDGGLLKMLDLSSEQMQKLERGDAVVYNERNGKSGRGVVVQDINASPPICMEKIRDLPMYSKMVPGLKSVDIYDSHTFKNGTSKTKAKFDLGVFAIRFRYFLHMTHEPSLNTLTWTLDYSKNSDVDDSVGHWQVMSHPKKSGCTRILYSTKIKMMPWIPEFFIEFMTGKALTEATGWLKRESELAQKAADRISIAGSSDIVSADKKEKKKSSWFGLNGGAGVSPLKIVPQVETSDQTPPRRSSHLPVTLRRFMKL